MSNQIYSGTILFEAREVDVPSGGELTDLVYRDQLGGLGAVANIEIENTGDNALTDFRVLLQDHPGGEWYAFVGGTDFLAPFAVGVRWVSATPPHTLPAGQKAHLHIEGLAANGIKLQAASTAGTEVAARGNALVRR